MSIKIKQKKNQINYFYNLFSDIKNNIDTLISKDWDFILFCKNPKEYEKSKPVALKSKLPDLAKLWLVEKTPRWEIIKYKLTPFWDSFKNNIINYKYNLDDDNIKSLILSSVLEYTIKWFRPYSMLIKFLYIHHWDWLIDRETFLKYLTIDIDDVISIIKDNKDIHDITFHDEINTEASRPLSYIINFLQTSNLITKENNKQNWKIKINKNIWDNIINYILNDEVRREFLDKDIYLKTYANRRGTLQVDFRKNILEMYKKSCVISNNYFIFRDLSNLEAAHIIPVSHWWSYEINNWLLLSRDLHYAFDKWAITLDDEYKIIVHENIIDNWFLTSFSWKQIKLPDNKEYWPNISYIKYHREKVFWKWV